MTRTPDLADLEAVLQPSTPALTPDGSRVVYALARHDAGESRSELWSVTTGGDRTATRLTSGAVDTAPVVSPDGSSVAFLRAVDGIPSIHLLPVGGGDPVRITEGLKVGGAPEFSPDGTHIAFTALVDDEAATPARPLVITGDPMHKIDGLGWVGTARSQIHVVPVTGGDVVRMPAAGRCGSPAWSPDGTRLAFTRILPDPSGRGLSLEVGLVRVAEPAEPRFPFAATGLSGPLVWTPDGAAVVAIGDVEVRVGVDRLVCLDAADGSVTILTPDLDRNVMGGGPGYPGGRPAFDADGRLVFCVRDGGQTVVHSIDPDGGDLRRHDAGAGSVVSGLSVQGTWAAVALSDPTTPGELALLDLVDGGTVRLTDHMRAALPDVEFLATEQVRFTISDGTVVHGWLLRSPDTEGPAPTLLDIHGGPHNAWTGTADTAHLYHQLLAARGWNVLTLNPRGSDGYGEQFTRAALEAWGEADADDFLEPLDRLIADGIADPDRLAVTGYSYGGFMTCWLTSHTDRFRSAVPGGLVAEHHSMDASSDLGAFLSDIEIGGSGNAVRLSPITYVEAVTTPTLILHGQDDQRCPLAQAELWYTRLRDVGVETRMVVYPGGSHLFILNGPLEHRVDYNRRVVDWVVGHLD